MRKYQSHKVVEAAIIESWVQTEAGPIQVKTDQGTWLAKFNIFARGNPQVGDYLVRYEDGYLSWSPAKAFEEGYTLKED